MKRIICGFCKKGLNRGSNRQKYHGNQRLKGSCSWKVAQRNYKEKYSCNRLGYFKDYYHTTRKSNPITMYEYRKRAWEYKYKGWIFLWCDNNL